MMTKYGFEISRAMVSARCSDLIGQYFKILPLREANSTTIVRYMEGLLREVNGLGQLIAEFKNDGQIVSLMDILEYHIDHPDADLETVRSDVFKAIDIIKRLRRKYAKDPNDGGDPDERVG